VQLVPQPLLFFCIPNSLLKALAALITPALVLGGLLPARAPVDLGEADQSQTGKGYRNRITAAIYRHLDATINQATGIIGSPEETFDGALISGHAYISLDNLRGKIDAPKIESFLTEAQYYARWAYMPNTEIQTVDYRLSWLRRPLRKSPRVTVPSRSVVGVPGSGTAAAEPAPAM
jgi:hypothetical protein